ncbi:hypothetical protein CONPUDRAFT_80238, partial [Coniophora puteana RWD-64-598 SS2]
MRARDISDIKSGMNYQTYMKGYTAIVNFSRQNSSDNPPKLYERFDAYFADVARSILASLLPVDPAASKDDSIEELILGSRIVARFEAYKDGAAFVDRMSAYLNRHYVRREVDEGKGWSRKENIVDKKMFEDAAQEWRAHPAEMQKLMKKWREKELKRWGFSQEDQGRGGGTAAEKETMAVQRAEAGSKLFVVVSTRAVALRRFRTEV